MNNRKYNVFHYGRFEKMTPAEVAHEARLPEDLKISRYGNEGEYLSIWSARISTGLFGRTNCYSGNRGPKEEKDILLALGSRGLEKFIEMGFVPCPVCKPEKVKEFWDFAKEPVKKKYGIFNLDDFVNKNVLGFDPRRLDWDLIFELNGEAPDRVYLPRGLSNNAVRSFAYKFKDKDVDVPVLGYYDKNAPGHFRVYEVD